MIYKDPNAELTYFVNWTDWLTADDEVASGTWTIPDGLTAVGSPTNSATHCFQKIKDGVVGNTYTVVCHMTTAAGEKDDRSLVITVKER